MRLIAAGITALLLVVIFSSYNTAQMFVVFARLSIGQAALLAALLFGNLILVCVRFHLILRRMNVPVTFWPATRANILSQISGLLLFQVVGQFIGRVAFLRQHGVPTTTVASITLYEKATSLAAAGLLMIAGLTILLGKGAGSTISDTLTRIPLPQLVVILGLAVAYSLYVGALRFERSLWSKLASLTTLRRFLEVVFLTLCSQGCMVAAYVVAAQQLQLSVSTTELAAAGSVVMFAASLPISISGWGIREMASVYALGLLNVIPERAIAISIFVGFASLFCLVIAAAAALLIRDTKAYSSAAGTIRNFAEQDKAAIALLAILIGSAIFFQLHIPIQGNLVDVDLADPLALIGGTYFVFRWSVRRQLPQWRVPYTNWALAAMTASIALAFAIGWYRFGVTPWATHNRLIGWAVILGYFFTGAAITGQWGLNGSRRFLETVAATGCVVSLYIIFSTYVQVYGWQVGQSALLPDFDLLSPNRNALAFELILAFIAATTASKRILWVGSGAILATLLLLASRAGWITATLVIVFALALKQIPLRELLKSVAAAALLLVPILLSASGGAFQNIQGIFHQSSDSERWYTLTGAFDLWRGHPIFGAGLGAYMNQELAELGHPLVVHNTALWLLAEFGLVGFGIFGCAYLGLLSWTWRNRRQAPVKVFVVAIGLVLISFGMFSMAHEILYQRLFWLILGTFLGVRESSQGNISRQSVTDDAVAASGQHVAS